MALLGAGVEAQMRAAAREQRFERAAWLRRRRDRLASLLDRLSGVLAATHARPRLVLAGEPPFDALWLVGGRIVDLAFDLPVEPDAAALHRRTLAALRHAPGRGVGVHLPRDEVDEVRIAGTWLAAHPDTPALALDAAPAPQALASFARRAAQSSAISYSNHAERDAPVLS